MTSQGGSPGDLTAQARLRQAAVAIIAESGTTALTARSVARRAGVSAGLVAHHFGSMEGLLEACDVQVSGELSRLKQAQMNPSAALNPLAGLVDEQMYLMRYLVNRLTDDSPTVHKLVRTMIDDAEVYLQVAVEQGMVRQSSHPRRRAAMLILRALGELLLHRLVKEELGVDLVLDGLADERAVADYIALSYELYQGILTEEFSAQVSDAIPLISERTDLRTRG